MKLTIKRRRKKENIALLIPTARTTRANGKGKSEPRQTTTQTWMFSYLKRRRKGEETVALGRTLNPPNARRKEPFPMTKPQVQTWIPRRSEGGPSPRNTTVLQKVIRLILKRTPVVVTVVNHRKFDSARPPLYSVRTAKMGYMCTGPYDRNASRLAGLNRRAPNVRRLSFARTVDR